MKITVPGANSCREQKPIDWQHLFADFKEVSIEEIQLENLREDIEHAAVALHPDYVERLAKNLVKLGYRKVVDHK